MKILFSVGKTGDNYHLPYTSRKSPKWLKSNIDKFEGFFDYDNEVPSDVAMAMYLSYKYPRSQIDCIKGSEIQSKKQLDEYDAVFIINDNVEVFLCEERKTCFLELKKFEKALSTTNSFVYPYPKFQKYIINKFKYYNDLKRAGIPVVDFIKAEPDKIISDISSLRKKIERKKWKGIIIKPSYGGYSTGIKVFKDFSKTKNLTVKNWFKKLKKMNFPNATIQEFIPEFQNNLEIRTYWINGKYSYSWGTSPIKDYDTFESEGGELPDKIKRKLKEIGRKVLKSIIQYKEPHPLIRIDFGCCIDFKECKNNYFVNEIETLSANMLVDEGFPVVEKVANALYNLAKKYKGKKEPKGVKSNFKSTKNICVKSVK